MIERAKRVAARLAKKVLGASAPAAVAQHIAYFGAHEAVAQAKARGMSLEQFIEAEWGVSGSIQETIAQMRAAGTFDKCQTIVEIGPGTGNYLRATRANARPDRYQIYETALDWRTFLARTEAVEAPISDGENLSASADQSVDLVHAHGVFTTVRALVSYGYFREMTRVCAPQGAVIFDFYSIEKFDPVVWLDSPHRYPMFLSRAQIIAFFEASGFALSGEWMKPWRPASTTYLVFRRA